MTTWLCNRLLSWTRCFLHLQAWHSERRTRNNHNQEGKCKPIWQDSHLQHPDWHFCCLAYCWWSQAAFGPMLALLFCQDRRWLGEAMWQVLMEDDVSGLCWGHSILGKDPMSPIMRYWSVSNYDITGVQYLICLKILSTREHSIEFQFSRIQEFCSKECGHSSIITWWR